MRQVKTHQQDLTITLFRVSTMASKLILSLASVAVLVAAAAAHSPGVAAGAWAATTIPETARSRVDPKEGFPGTPDILLVGIAFSNNATLTLAVIEAGTERRQRLIRAGDRVGNILVKQILRDRVVLVTDRGELIARINRVLTRSESSGGPFEFTPPLSVKLPPMDNTKIVEVEREKLFASLGHSEDGLTQINIDPIVVYGQSIGIRISPIAPGGIFEELGLETGDIITAVNGRKITNSEQAIQFLEQIQDGGDFDISIRGSRREKEIQLLVK